MRGRQGQHCADALKSLPVRVFRQAGGIGGIVVHPEQVMDGVGVLLAAELVEGDAFALCQAGGLAFFEPARQPFHHLRRRLGFRLRLVIRGHLPGADAVHHIGPVHGGGAEREIARQGVQPQLALVLLLAMAPVTVLGQEGFDLPVEIRQRGRPAAGTHENARERKTGRWKRAGHHEQRSGRYCAASAFLQANEWRWG